MKIKMEKISKGYKQNKLKDTIIKKFKESTEIHRAILEKDNQIQKIKYTLLALEDQKNYLEIGMAKVEAEIDSLEMEIKE